MEEEQVPRIPNLDLIQQAFLLSRPDSVVPAEEKAAVKASLMKEIEAGQMLPFYLSLCERLHWPVDQALTERMRTANAAREAQLEAAITDARENLGETEHREALLAKAEWLARLGEKDKALAAYRAANEKTVGPGQRLELVLAQVRVALFHQDHEQAQRLIERARQLAEEGGDWDRRNRLKVYEAVELMATRQWRRASALLLETLAAFAAPEMFSFERFVVYTVLLGVYALERPALKARLLQAPEVLQVLHRVPHLADFLQALHATQYARFFQALAGLLESQLKRDVWLARHARFFAREMRVKAYAQLLESYRAVQLASMASAFGVSREFLDRELSRFVAAGRLHCKIDAVQGVLETTRPDSKNHFYQATLRDGDLLLNRVQKLSRVINL
jgi:26S proteasome regulatory subunit N7